MAEYVYKGVDKSGKRVSGKQEAANETDLRVILRSKGIRPISFSQGGNLLEKDLGELFRGGQVSVPLKELLLFTRQIQVLIGSGIPLVQALDVLENQMPHKGFKKVIRDIHKAVSEGSFFWQAIAKHPGAFPRVYISLVRAGEASGSLETILKRLNRYLEDADRIRRMVKGAMVYPIIVLSVSIGVIGVMVYFVVPKMEDMLKSSNATLPAPTQMLVNFSHFVVDNILMLLIGTAAIIYFILTFIKTASGRVIFHRFVYRIPIFGDVFVKASVARFARTFATLINAGVPLLDSLEICRNSIDNAVFEEDLAKVRQEVETGKNLAVVLNTVKTFPKMATQMIHVGESTGNVDKMFEKIADFYETDVESVVNNLSKIIEPFLIVFLGGIVAFILVSMYLPIFKQAGSMGG